MTDTIETEKTPNELTHRGEPAARAGHSTGGCCGGPAPAGAAACCAQDAEVKSAGGSGCGCGESHAAPAPRRQACC